MYFPDYSAVLVCDDQDDHYTKPLGESEIPIPYMYKWYNTIREKYNYKLLHYRLMYDNIHKRTTIYNIKYVCDNIIKDLGLPLKEL